MGEIKLMLANGREWCIGTYISQRSGAIRWSYTEFERHSPRPIKHSRGFATLAEAQAYARTRSANI